MKRILSFLAIAFIINSCSNSSSNAVSNSNSLVSKIISTTSSGSTTTITFSYSGNKITELNSSTTQNIYTYTGDHITTVETMNGQVLFYRTTFTFDAAGRVVSERMNSYTDNSAQNRAYTYNSDGTISVAISAGDINTYPLNLIRNAKIFLDAIGEVAKIENYDLSNNFVNKTVYTNDGKNSPVKNILGFNKQPYFFEKYCNMIAIDNYDINNQITSNSTKQYTYNSDNFPSAGTQINYSNGSVNGTTTIQYFY